MKKIGQFAFTAASVIALATVLYLAPWFAGIAHAASDPGAAVVAATSSLGWPEWFGIGLAAIAGIKAVVDGALAFFRYLAPKTATTVDDSIRDDLQLAHDKLDALTGLVQSIKPVTAPTPKIAQGGFTRPQVMLLLAGAGVALMAAMGCAGSTQGTRQATLSTATVVASTMLRTVETYDQVHGDAIIHDATDKAKAAADLAAFRTKVHAVVKVITGMLDAIGIANTANDDASLAGVQKALNETITDVTALTGGK